VTAGVPKAELHCHIEGAAMTGLAQGQARKYNVDISGLIENECYRWTDFTTFLEAYDTVSGLFRTQEDYSLLAETYLKDIARQGAIYSEIFVSTDHARLAGLAPEAYLEGLGEGIARARDASGIEGRIIMTCIRHLGADAAVDVARLAAADPYPLVTGFGMGGDERMGSHADFIPAFDIAREAGLGITTHAGEFGGPDSVVDALDNVRPTRLGHGVRSIEDPALVERLAQSGIVLELCPGSNVALGLYKDLATHPFAQLREAGVPVTLNSDDPPFFGTSIGAEYEYAARYFGLDEDDLKAVTRTAIEAAFVDEDTRSALLAKL